MSLKLETEGVMLNVVSGYAPQVLDKVMESIPTGERVVIGADFNGHVGEENTGDEEVMGKFGVKERNLEGQMVVYFAKRMDMAVVNTYFQKREEHRVTYKSGGRRTQADYILCRRGNLKEISDCKVVVGESVARQHRMVVCRMTFMVCKMKRSKIEIEKKTKWWKLKKEECFEEFRQKLRQALGGQVVLPDDWETTAEVIRKTGRKVLGVSSGRRKEDKETWWWNEEVQDSIQRKRLAYDRVPREELWYCMRKSGVAEKYVRVVQDMYERSRTVVRCAVGQTEEFKVELGLHQGSALSPFLFAIVMDQLSEEVRQESPWTMMFADDIVICSESREQVEENLERWRFALERRGMKVSRSKTEYMCVNEREGSGTVRLQGEEVKKVQEFKYLGSTVQSNGECGKEVKKRVQAGWNGWRKVSGVLCDRKISARIKGKVYRTVVRPAMLYGLETVSLRKRQESELEVAELKMLRFSFGVTRLDRIRNEYIRGTAHVGCLGDKVREARLRWFGHVQRRESEYIGRRMLYGYKDAASLPSAEDGPNLTFIFIFIFAGTRSASLLISRGDRRPHLPPSLPVGVFGPAGLRSSLISTTCQGTSLGAAARRWMSFGSAARRWMSLGASARLWTSFGTLRPYRRARRSPHFPRLAPRSSHSPHRVPRSRHLPRLAPRSPHLPRLAPRSPPFLPLRVLRSSLGFPGPKGFPD
ncbi:hypothetical protein QTP86_018118 [Hemibagrus guttatus]|nr:hypothetical protein QTP86_018118 [Hemibagrus guttatus]